MGSGLPLIAKGSLPHDGLVVAPYCKLHAMAIRRNRLWCMLAMVTQEYFGIGDIIGEIVRGMRTYYGDGEL